MKDDPYLLLHQYLHGAKVEEIGEARKSLLSLGTEAVGPLIEVMESRRREAPENLMYSSQARRLASLLAEFHDTRSLVPILQVSYMPGNRERGSLFRQVVAHFAERGTLADARALTDLLRQSLPRWVHGALLIALDPLDRLALAQALVQIARHTPYRELHDAVPLLGYSLGESLELIQLRRELKKLLRASAFPIPATAGQATQDLPIPGQEPESEK